MSRAPETEANEAARENAIRPESAYLATLASMEPAVSAVDAVASYASTAISQRRIANALERIAEAMEGPKVTPTPSPFRPEPPAPGIKEVMVNFRVVMVNFRVLTDRTELPTAWTRTMRYDNANYVAYYLPEADDDGRGPEIVLVRR